MANVVKGIDELNLNGFWKHFDTDIISDDENPAVDYRLPDGLTFKEFARYAKPTNAHGKMTGISAIIFNSTLDKKATIAIKIADCFVAAL